MPGKARGSACTPRPSDELDRAMDRALVHDGPCLIEVPIDPHDCSEELREWGQAGRRRQRPRRREPARTTRSFDRLSSSVRGRRRIRS